jgi:hypothetical protein
MTVEPNSTTKGRRSIWLLADEVVVEGAAPKLLLPIDRNVDDVYRPILSVPAELMRVPYVRSRHLQWLAVKVPC